MLSLILSLFIYSAHAREHDLPCDAHACVIPYDSEGTQNGVETCYTDEKKSKKIKEVRWKNGKREGQAFCWREDKLTYEANYKNDLLNGPFIQYDYDSRGDRVWLMEDDQEAGLSFSAKQDKVTDFSYCIVNGSREFNAVLTCPDKDYGRFDKEVSLFKDQLLEKKKKDAVASAKLMNGPQESKYPSGKIKAKWVNLNGNIHGDFTSYFENGNVQNQCHYIDGKEDGLCIAFDVEKRMDKRETWVKGKTVKIEEFYDNGHLEQLTDKSAPPKACITKYYDTGNKQLSHCVIQESSYYRWYDYSTYDGPYQSWNEGNVLAVSGNYLKGQRVGVWEYFEDKNLTDKMTYENGHLVKSIAYFRSPTMYRIVREYFPDGSVKSEVKLEGLEGDKQKVI